jgi:hypothetical protein
LLKCVEVIVSKDEQALIKDDFLSLFTGCIQDEAGSVTSRNGSGHIDQVSFPKIDPHVDRDGFGLFCCSGLRTQ